MEDTEKENKVVIGVKAAPIIRQAVENLAAAEDRTLSQMAEILIKDSRKVKAEIRRIQESEAVATA